MRFSKEVGNGIIVIHEMSCINYQLYFFEEFKILFELKHQNWPCDRSLKK